MARRAIAGLRTIVTGRIEWHRPGSGRRNLVRQGREGGRTSAPVAATEGTGVEQLVSRPDRFAGTPAT
jgi:hypothetical protein